MLGLAGLWYPGDRGWVFHQGNCPTVLSLLARFRPVLCTAEHGTFPRQDAFWASWRHGTWPRSAGLCWTGVREYYSPLRLLAPHREKFRSRLYPPLTAWGLQVALCIPCFPPFRLRVSHDCNHTFQVDDTRSPWVTYLSSPPCRPHTPCCDGEEPSCLRLHSAGSTIPHLWPTGSSVGWLPLITTRWFSASPSDLTSR
jgi:hypothetical protein